MAIENLEPRLTPTTKTFSFINAAESWVVPDGAGKISISMLGGGAGQGGIDYQTSGGAAGPAGKISGNLFVNPGETLTFYIGEVGGHGGNNETASGGGAGGRSPFASSDFPSGFSGGKGGDTGSSGASGGGGGGGAASLLSFSNSQGISYLVAAGAGGGGGAGNPPQGTPGSTYQFFTSSTTGQAGSNVPVYADGGGGGGGLAISQGSSSTGGGFGGSLSFSNNEYYGNGGYAGSNFSPGQFGFASNYATNSGNGLATITYILAPSNLAISNDSGLSISDRTTNDTNLVFNGTSEPGALVSLFQQSTTLGPSVTPDANGNWTFDYTSTTLGEGTHFFTANAKLNSQAESAFASFSVTIDTKNPAATVDIVAASLSNGAPSSPVKFEFSEAVVGFDASDLTTAGGTLSNFTIIDADSYSATFTATDGIANKGSVNLSGLYSDMVGNIGSGAGDSVDIDTAEPKAPEFTGISEDSGASASDRITSDTTLVLSGSAEPESKVSLFRGGQSIGGVKADTSGSWTFDYTSATLADGSYSFSAKATDAAGNTSAAGETPVTVDTQNPKGKFLTPGTFPGIPTLTVPLGKERLVYVEWDEAMAGLPSLADFKATGPVTLSAIRAVNPKLLELTVEAAKEGAFSISLPSKILSDLGGNLSQAIAATTIRADATWSFSSALSLGKSAVGQSDGPKDDEFFKVKAGNSGSMVLRASAKESNFDPYLSAFVETTAGHFEPIISDDNSGGGTASIVRFNTEQDQEYFIKVSTLKTQSGNFLVEMEEGQRIEDDFGNDLNQASPLVLDATGAFQQRGKIEKAGDEDFFKFSARQSGVATLGLTGSILETGRLAVLNANGTPIKLEATTEGSQFPVEAGKAYYISVSSQAASEYRISNSIEALLVFSNQQAKATGALNAQTLDTFKFTAPASGLFAFQASDRQSGAMPGIRILDQNMAPLVSQAESSFGPKGYQGMVNVELTSGQVYHVQVGGGAYVGSYALNAGLDDYSSQSKSAATALSGTQLQGMVNLAGDADLFSLNYVNSSTTEMTRLRFNHKAINQNQSRLDSLLYFSSDGGATWTLAGDEPGSLNSQQEVKVGPGESKSVLLWAAGAGGSAGEYALSYQALSDDLPDRVSDFGEKAPAIALANLEPGIFKGTVNFAGDMDLRRYTATKSGVFTLNLAASDSTLDPKLGVLDAKGNLLFSDDDSGPGVNSRLTLKAEKGGEYYIQFSDSTRQGENQAYQFSITEEVQEDDHGDSVKFATGLNFTDGSSASSQGEISNRVETFDSDIFRITSPAAGIFNFAATPGPDAKDFSPVFKIIKEDLSVLASSVQQPGGKPALSRVNLAAGETYYIQLQGGGKSQGNYRLEVNQIVQQAPPDDFANAINSTSKLPFGTISAAASLGKISVSKDVDLFQFLAAENGQVQVDLKAAAGSKLDTVLAALNSQGAVVGSNDNFGKSSDSRLIFETAKGSTYYLAASGFGGSLGNYELSLKPIVHQDADGAGNNTGAIPASHVLVLDSANQANSLGTINAVGDRDLFKLEITTAGILNLGLNAAATSKLDGYLRIYQNSLENLVVEDDNFGSGFNSLVALPVNAGEVIYLQTAGVGSSVGDYKVWARLDTDDHGNTRQSASLLANSGNFATTLGEIQSAGESDFFEFVPVTTEIVKVSLAAESGSNLDAYLSLYDSSGSLLAYSNNQTGDASLGASDSLLFRCLEAGKSYYFEVQGASQTTGAFELQVEPVVDDFGSTPGRIALAGNQDSQEGEIEACGDEDLFKLAPEVSGNYRIRLFGTGPVNPLDTQLTVKDMAGNILASNDDASPNVSHSFISIDLTAGETYLLTAASYGGGVGTYRMEVLHDPSAAADDHGNTASAATSLVLGTKSTEVTGSFSHAGDVDAFKGVAFEDTTISLGGFSGPAGGKTGVKVFLTQDGESIQLASSSATSPTLSFKVSSGDEFHILLTAPGDLSLSTDYSFTLSPAISSESFTRPVDQTQLDNLSNELIGSFSSVATNLSAADSINLASSKITEELVNFWIASQDPTGSGKLDQDYLLLWLDPVDFVLNTPTGQVGNSQGNQILENKSASLSSKGALDLVVIPAAQATQYNLQLTGVGAGQVLAGAALVTANGQVINPTVTQGGQAVSGFAAADVPKSGLSLVLDFGSKSSGSTPGGSPGPVGNNGQSGPIDSTTGSNSGSQGIGASFSSSLLNAISQVGTTGFNLSATALAQEFFGSLVAGGGVATQGIDDLALEMDLQKLAITDETGMSLEPGKVEAQSALSVNPLISTAKLVVNSLLQSGELSVAVVETTLTAQEHLLQEVSRNVDRAISIFVPSEFETSLDSLVDSTGKVALEEGAKAFKNAGGILADLVQARLKAFPQVEKQGGPGAQLPDNLLPAAQLPANGDEVVSNLPEDLFDLSLGDFTHFTANWDTQMGEFSLGLARHQAISDQDRFPEILVGVERKSEMLQAAGLAIAALLAPSLLSQAHGGSQVAREKPKRPRRNTRNV
ncbi:MAG: hypothetical protein EXR99_07910 [Gemmataceae bacterium]|nr:hypothetical protein [Gemmataceae bacterium]